MTGGKSDLVRQKRPEKGRDTMEKNDIRYKAYVSILDEELKPAMGCTEPIAIAYCAAVAREVLGGLPERVKVGASGSRNRCRGSEKGT